ncbi:hypothetical protein [Ancrocorticia populi]|uniref:hypothetical protein n=1 Tax=Ancrocorticia populi TaxID=2175228 RepID=UPI003F9E0BDA
MKRLKTSTRIAGLLVASAAIVSGCSSSPSDNAEPEWDLTAAPDAKWVSVAGIAAPMSDNDGPASTDPVPHGYAPSPQGAVLSAINGQIQMATADDATWPDVSTYLLAPGPGRDQWAQARSLVSVSGEVADPARFVGFKVTEFNEEKAQVVLASELPDGQLVAYPVQMERLNQTWRLILPTQEEAVDFTPLDNIDGFTRFSAEEN